MTRQFRAAPWSALLKGVSLFSTILLGAISITVYRAAPVSSEGTQHFGLGAALLPSIVLVGSAFFIVRSYTVDSVQLSIRRLFTDTRIPLAGLRRAWADPEVVKRSIRIFGNGGLFSFSGWFYDRRLGRFRLFATDFRSVVVLQFAGRVVVVSPAEPHAFVEHLQHLIPGLQTASQEERT